MTEDTLRDQSMHSMETLASTRTRELQAAVFHSKPKRARWFSWLIGQSFAVTLVQFGMMMLPSFRHAGLFVPAIYGIIITATFISLVGIWHMKKWGVEMLIYSFLVREIFLAIMGEVSSLGIIYQLLLIGLSLIVYRKMDRNL